MSSGNVSGRGTLTVAAGETLTVSGGDHYVDSKSIVNDGTVNWTAGRIDLDGSSSLANNGVFELAAVAGLTLYGVPETEAVGWALGFHLLSFIPITVLGSWYFTRMNLHLRDLRQPPVGDGLAP